MRSKLLLGLALLATTGCDPASARSNSTGEDSPITNVTVHQPAIDVPLPDFELVDRQGRPFKKTDMVGKVWVVNFIFTTCPMICPALTKKMAGLQKELAADPDVRFLSITVDAETDKPPVLDEYAKKNGGEAESWYWVTGEPQVVDNVVIKGFLMSLQRDSAKKDISHAERFVVVDKTARVKGLFDTDDAGLAALKKRVAELKAQ